MTKVLSVDIERCTGCRSCELACTLKHEGEYSPTKSRIYVASFPEKSFSMPVVCFQCEEAWCAKVCPAGAIQVTTNTQKGIRVVEIVHDRCVGCRICLLACPLGNIGFSNSMATKCDLCSGDPECVRVCVAEALRFEEAEVSMARKRRSTATKILASYQQC